ncbi:MAG: aminopeptidase P family protein [Pseudomonadota bacterium]
MFQTFENTTDPSLGAARVAALRNELSRRGLDGFLVPRADAHQGEYVAAADERLRWLTGFSGSAGYAAILQQSAGLFVDGRYTLQARGQCDGAVFSSLSIPGDSLGGWLTSQLSNGATVGYDAMLHTRGEIETLRRKLAAVGMTLKPVANNPVDTVWDDRPAPPRAPIVVHDLALAGTSAEQKIADMQTALAAAHQDAMILTLPDSIAWLLNIRGSDIAHTPVTLAFAIVHADRKPELFVHADKIDATARAHLEPFVELLGEDDLQGALATLTGQRVRIDPKTAPDWFFSQLEASDASINEGHDLVLHAKARKSDSEIAGSRAAHLRDGVAMARFLAWLAAAAPKGNVTEISAARQLEAFRAEGGLLRDLSFDTISGAGPNGAIVHYRVTEATDSSLEPGSLYLIDSGGQYRDGTTDITRTVAIGTPDDEMRRCYTHVLKGHIALAQARFPKGTRGVDLDPLARQPLWSAGLDYDHGTGHGIGSYLSVHEGPTSISKRGMVALAPGMMLSNEPGYYREGAFGIRLENLVLVTPPAPISGGDREMMAFETLSFTPFDRTLIDVALLDDRERAWLNTYHADVLAKIGPELSDHPDVRAWLEAATVPL